MFRISKSSSSEIGIIFYLSFEFILNIILFLFIMFLVYSSSTFVMVMIVLTPFLGMSQDG